MRTATDECDNCLALYITPCHIYNDFTTLQQPELKDTKSILTIFSKYY